MPKVTSKTIDMSVLQSLWSAFDAIAHVRPVRDSASYDQMQSLMNILIETVGDDEDHPLAGLLNSVGDLVSHYEQYHYPIQLSDPRDALRYLMEMKGLKQEDLGQLVPQSNLSAILSGKRKITAQLARKLDHFFDVNVALFIPR
jgi:HTH-type transcriptional regulator/antitoxin HigA